MKSDMMRIQSGEDQGASNLLIVDEVGRCQRKLRLTLYRGFLCSGLSVRGCPNEYRRAGVQRVLFVAVLFAWQSSLRPPMNVLVQNMFPYNIATPKMVLRQEINVV